MKTKLLVLELWGLGDLALATPFLQAASRHFQVTLVAKSFAQELRTKCWPEIKVLTHNAPWTAFKHKYQFNTWPWREIFRLARRLRSERFDCAVSVRSDPRDHLLLRLFGVRQRFGFPRMGSQALLTHPVAAPPWPTHRYEHWRILGRALDLDLPALGQWDVERGCDSRLIVVHTGSAQALRVWPLGRYAKMIEHLRGLGYQVQVACDSTQKDWWQGQGERSITPGNVVELMALLERAAVFVGNDSGPGHLAAVRGIPTFTIFGPQLPALFRPIHRSAEWVEGDECGYKPCYDKCRFAQPFCLLNVTDQEVLARVEAFVKRHL